MESHFIRPCIAKINHKKFLNHERYSKHAKKKRGETKEMEAELVMKKEELYGKYQSEYQKRIIERFADTIPEYIYPPNDDVSRKNYDVYMSFICLLEAPEQYQTADKVIDYLEKNPKATVEDTCKYFDEITPDGLPPCASEWEDDEDEE